MDGAPFLFGSRSIGRHLLRGLVGGIAFVIAVPLFFLGEGWPAMAGALCFGLVSVVALRGCPLCWVVGLVETVIIAWRGRAGRACASCGPPG